MAEATWIILRREGIIPPPDKVDPKDERIRKNVYQMIYEVKLKERTHACRTPEDTYRFWSLARRDKDAAAKYSNEKGCLMIPAGITVALVERDPVARMSGIRLKDDKTIYYVPAADAN